MSDIKAEKLLPKELVEQIQKYADGVCIHIPRKEENRHRILLQEKQKLPD